MRKGPEGPFLMAAAQRKSARGSLFRLSGFGARSPAVFLGCRRDVEFDFVFVIDVHGQSSSIGQATKQPK